MNEVNPIKIVSIVLVAIFIGILALFGVRWKTVHANEMGVKETWTDGVQDVVLAPRTYVIFPMTQTIYTHNMGAQVYTMEGGHAYRVQSKDQQDMEISMTIQWHRLPENLVALHKYARENFEEIVLKPTLLNIVKNQSTLRTALEAYSGETLVKLQEDILKELRNSDELKRYIAIDTYTIKHIQLDPQYTKEIVARQVAVQERLKNIEQTRAAEANAEKAKALAQADYEKTIVEARRDKERGILGAEQAMQQEVLAAEGNAKKVTLSAEAEAKKVAFEAEAEKNRNVLIAQGERDAAMNRAQAIEALGRAEADAMKLKLGAYSAAGAEGFVRIEVAKSLASAFQNVKGWLPADVNYSVVGRDFTGAVNVLVGDNNSKSDPVTTPVAPAPAK